MYEIGLDLKLSDDVLSNIKILGNAIHESDIGSDFISDRLDGYSWYYRIAQAVKPSVILEIGTRFGYGILAMCGSREAMASVTSVYCVDNESCAPGSMAYAAQQFQAKGIPYTMLRVDSQRCSTLDLHDVDLCHVDAQHTTDGCFHDAMLCWESLKDGGYMLIDDVKWYTVARGANEFLHVVKRSAVYIASFRGMYVVRK